MIGWALRWVMLCCGIVLLGVGLLDRGAALLPDIAARFGRRGQAETSAPRASVQKPDTEEDDTAAQQYPAQRPADHDTRPVPIMASRTLRDGA